nr:RNA polymerase sporulation sigma factor SigH [bacterium]
MSTSPQPTDETLALAAQAGDEAALERLLEGYKPFVRARVRGYYLMGADNEDMMQEGMIGLYKAIRDFNPARGVSLHAFADICIRRQMVSAIRAAARHKHSPLNSSVSLDLPMADDDVRLGDLVASSGANPEEVLLVQESYDTLESRISPMLSEMERRVLRGFLQGKSYSQIAADLGRTPKSIDNALQRIRQKVQSLGDLGLS